MNKLTRNIIIVLAVLLAIAATPFVFKGVVITAGLLGLAAILAGVFLLGMFVMAAVLSPLWIPFLAGWATMKYCKKYYTPKKNDIPPVA